MLYIIININKLTTTTKIENKIYKKNKQKN